MGTPPDQIRGHRAEILPEIDVAEIATAVYDFLSAASAHG